MAYSSAFVWGYTEFSRMTVELQLTLPSSNYAVFVQNDWYYQSINDALLREWATGRNVFASTVSINQSIPGISVCLYCNIS